MIETVVADVFGQMTTVVPKIGLFFLLFAALQVVALILRPIIRAFVRAVNKRQVSGLSPIQQDFERSFTRLFFAVYEIIAFTSALRAVGITGNEALTMTGIFSIAISLSIKDVILDVVGGLYAIIVRHIQIGFWLEVEGDKGFINEIGIFKTRLVDPSGVETYVSNRVYFNRSIRTSGDEMAHYIDLDCNPDEITPVRRIALEWAKRNPFITGDPAWVLVPGTLLTGSGVQYRLSMPVSPHRFAESVAYASEFSLSEEIYKGGHKLSIDDVMLHNQPTAAK